MKKRYIRILSLLLCLTLLFSSASLVSCSTEGDRQNKIKILCTVFPLYDWAKSIVGESENAEVLLLVENGTDLHSFQPSFGDMAKIKDSDIVIYIGGESDKWVADSVDEDAVSIELSALDDTVLYEISSDSIASSHSHDGEDCHEAHGHEHEFDEHIWLSLKNAAVACESIRDTICTMDPQGSELYFENTERYLQSLSELDSRMQALSPKITSPIIFADRFPMVYLLADYGIDYFAAFEGCSTDVGADFSTVITLAKKIDLYQSKYIFVTENPVPELADSIIARTDEKNAEIVSLDSMQSLGSSDIADGISYISAAEKNITALEKYAQ